MDSDMSLDTARLIAEIAAGEDTHLELKEIVWKGDQVRLGGEGKKAADELAEVLCSLANTDGGTLVLGVRKDGEILGVAPDKKDLLEQFVVNLCLNNCKPLIEPILDWRLLPDSNQTPRLCLVVQIPKSRHFIHQTTDGRFLMRIGSHRHPIPAERLGRMLAERDLSQPFEERPIMQAPATVIDRQRFRTYVLRRFGPSADLSDPDRLLGNLKLTVKTETSVKASALGVLLFTDHPETHLGGAYIDLAAYTGTVADGNTADAKRLTGPLPEQIEQVIRYFQTSPLIATRSVKDAAGRFDRPTYVGTALQEAVVNAVVHRDYELTGSQVIIRLLKDRIEIQNPGKLHNTLTVENLYAGCQPMRRNQLLAGFLRDFPSPVTGASLMEARGEGFLNLVRDSERLSGRRPLLERIGEAVKLTIYAAEES